MRTDCGPCLEVGDSAPGGDVRVECLLREETIWLTQRAIAELFGGKDI